MWVLTAALLLSAAPCGPSALRTGIPLPPPDLSAEAQCALTLLPMYFGGEQGFDRLHVVASAGWVDDAFLGRLSAIGVPFTIEQDVDVVQIAVMVGTIRNEKTLVLVAVENVNLLPKTFVGSPYIRYLVWLSTRAHSPIHFAEVRVKATEVCQMEMRLAVTSIASGSTRLYNLKGGCELSKNLTVIGLSYSVLPNVTELDRWFTESGWQRGGGFPYGVCVSWQPSLGEHNALEVLIETSSTTEEERRLAAVVISAVQRYRKLNERRFSIILPTGLFEIWKKHWECGLDLLIYPYIRFAKKYIGFPWQMEGLVAVVPADLRLRGQLGLSSLTKPLTITMWCASAAAAAAVGLGLWLHAAGNTCLEAGLQTISPLLAQPVTVRASRLRRVLGVWLLASVVLSAAYQCDLRSTLLAPKVTTYIKSERELADSNLTIIFSKISQVVSNRSWPHQGHNKLIEDLDERDGMQRVAQKRDAALLTDTTRLPYLLRGFERQVHTFRIPGGDRIKTFITTTTGSPLEAPLKKVIPRLRAAGLLERIVVPTIKKSGNRKPSRLNLENVVPAFTMLAEGLAVAFSVFLGEVCAGSASGLRSWARRGNQ